MINIERNQKNVHVFRFHFLFQLNNSKVMEKRDHLVSE